MKEKYKKDVYVLLTLHLLDHVSNIELGKDKK